ncbi:hypothetical protein Taro_030310 [Colocasia esculenta]|uniref:Uncharacterized protein n=1 Tax=Colocasia esculenta TaxID=4460 RepID=A0A843VL50_COLES|nr:hypothetical protein [Colocasia esculenta]
MWGAGRRDPVSNEGTLAGDPSLLTSPSPLQALITTSLHQLPPRRQQPSKLSWLDHHPRRFLYRESGRRSHRIDALASSRCLRSSRQTRCADRIEPRPRSGRRSAAGVCPVALSPPPVRHDRSWEATPTRPDEVVPPTPNRSSPGACGSALHVYIYEAITLVAITFVSALLVWVRRRHPARRHRGSEACYVAIRFPPRRHSLSRPHTPCVRLEHSLEGLRKSPLTVDSHTVAGLVVPVAT